jgi:sugar phosphate isomerase/epimerase
MKILYFRGLWGMESPSLAENLRRIKAGGFDGVETSAPRDPAAQKELRGLLDELGLAYIAQMYTQGSTPVEHAQSFAEQYQNAAGLHPLYVNSHTGRDTFSLQENLVVFRKAAEIEARTGIPALHETHRGRALYTVPASLALLAELPELKLTADFSHWCCVHESLLQDQAGALEEPIRRSRLIHARVGHAEGPQVSDPRAPEWSEAVEAHLAWWQAIVRHNRQIGTPALAITPEFGPPAYMPTLPYTRQPVASLWEVNVYMMEMLKSKLEG